ncbi:MAG: lipid-A-disaccharide synthase [Candidatus Gastranaerophilales bacterium]
MKKIFVVTGEHSGDIHASKVVEALLAKNSELIIEGIGGENLRTKGVKLFSDQKKMGAVGLSAKIILDHFTLGKRLVDYLINDYKPDLVLLVDYGAFNLAISKYLKKAGIKVFYYIPPQVWASRKWRINTIKKNIDNVLCIFPFEKKMYDKMGIKSHYCGHPLVSQIEKPADREAFFKKHDFDVNKKLVSIFPGSRVFELQHLMDTFIKSSVELQKRHPDLQFCISQAPNLSDEVYNKYLKEVDFKVVKGENQALLSVSDALILASGTVALEASLYTTPMIIAYRGPSLFYFIYLLVRSIKQVSLPNIIAEKDIVPELIQFELSVNNIAYEIERLLYDEQYRAENISQLSDVKSMLSDKISCVEVANSILKEIS